LNDEAAETMSNQDEWPLAFLFKGLEIAVYEVEGQPTQQTTHLGAAPVLKQDVQELFRTLP